MKKVIYSLILLLVVVSGLVFANCQIKNETAKIVFKSTDGGQTWQDISKGLPENLRVDSIRGNSFFANDKGLFLRVGKELYHTTPNATAPFWTKEISPDRSIASGKPRDILLGRKFEKNKRKRMYGRRYSTIPRSHDYAAVLKLPEVLFSSAPTAAFLKLLTMEKPGNLSMPEAM